MWATSKAVIFDVDGTLLDSVDYHAEAWRRAFAHAGYEVSFDGVRTQIGKGGDQILPVFIPKDVLEKRGKEIEQYRHDLRRLVEPLAQDAGADVGFPHLWSSIASRCDQRAAESDLQFEFPLLTRHRVRQAPQQL